MPTTKLIVCLANSRKLSGRCIAGRELVGGGLGGWIRPVSDRPHEEVSEYERNYADGSDPQVLDVIEVPLLDPRATRYQRENWLLDPDIYWEKLEQWGWGQVSSLIEPVASLWIDGHKTYHGKNDKMSLDVAARLQSSLVLIHVARLQIEVFAPGANFGDTKRRVLARFEHALTEYGLWVTDPRYERRFLALPDGTYELGESCLTISLGEPLRGEVYKLVAAIIERAGISP